LVPAAENNFFAGFKKKAATTGNVLPAQMLMVLLRSKPNN
jgi:hypothetical protein